MKRTSCIALLMSCAVLVSSGSASQPPAASGESEYNVITPGHDWILSWNAPDEERLYALTISNKSQPLMGLKPVQFGLRRTDGDSSIDIERLRMLTSPGGSPVETVDLRPHETKTVFLRLDPGSSRGPFGTFGGSVQLAADGTPVKVLPLTAKVSSGGVRFAGAILVLIGLGLSIALTTYLQPRLVRLQALRPASVLRETILAFAAEARIAAGDDTKGIENEARQQATRLEERALDAEGLLPPRISLSNSPATDATSRLKQRLDEISSRLGGLIVLRDAILQLRTRAGAGARPRPVDDAIAQLNRVAPEAVTAEAGRALVARAIEQLRTAGIAENALDVRTTALSVEQIDFSLQHAASMSWAIWGLVSLAIGVTYVYSDVDFGTAIDLLGVFLWGFGLTTFGAGIQQLTPASVATHVGLKVPTSGGSAT